MLPLPAPNTEDFLHVSWDPRAAEGRVALARRRFVAGVSSLVLTVVVWGGLYLWSRRSGQEWSGTGQWFFAGIVLGLSLVLLLVRLAIWRMAVRHRRQVGEGEVITASWPGLQIAGYYWDWDQVGQVGSVRGRRGGGDRYVIDTPNGPWSCEVDDLDTTPAALHAALALYSQGRCGVAMERIAH
ncbi:hypothetical protein GA0111570_10164 [Raineyella antarctica]|uniref:PH domain-containing protein n=1 Tax=Raineyella antarctica TaxID=1577474 RepID=A0A1G6GDI8_9ACTN|nr:hypothetical protein [Raineyella antarctica]SDB79795.1 hypothetical protein GA0111570_10164 [Raineyella antarctica]